MCLVGEGGGGGVGGVCMISLSILCEPKLYVTENQSACPTDQGENDQSGHCCHVFLIPAKVCTNQRCNFN